MLAERSLTLVAHFPLYLRGVFFFLVELEYPHELLVESNDGELRKMRFDLPKVLFFHSLIDSEFAGLLTIGIRGVL